MPTPDPRDDLVHQPRDDPKWRESYYWDLCDPAGEMMLYSTFGKRPHKGRSGHLTALWDSARGELLAAQDIDTFERHDDHHSIAGLRLECLRPFRRWRLSFDGTLVRCPRVGAVRFAEPRRIPEAERERVPVSFEVELSCLGEPRVYEPDATWSATFDGHHEQLTSASGVLSVDGTERELRGLPGIRDHSWGTRDWHGVVESRWIAAALEDDGGLSALSLMRQARADGSVALDGALYGGDAATALEDYDEEVSYEDAPGEGEPPEARRISVRVGAGGEELRMRGEVRAMLPIVFADPRSGRLTWNDRSFVAFEADGRRGFGTVEFQRLIEPAERG